MLAIRDNLSQSFAALRAHKLRAALTTLGLTMGVATLIAVMTLVQGANLYVEQKIANLGTNVFQVSRLPLIIIDFDTIIKALRNKHITLDDMRAVAARCAACAGAGATASLTMRVRYDGRELEDVQVNGHTPAMGDIDTRTVGQGRYFTEQEDLRAANVCVMGAKPAEEFFAGMDPLGRQVRAGNTEFTVIGVYQKIGSVLGQEQDNFLVVPMSAYRRLRGGNFSVVLYVKAASGGRNFELAQDQVRTILRGRRHLSGSREDDFFIGTAQSYIALWESISSAFFAVFVMVSSISAVVGGIVIMNVMLVSVTERTKEIGVRRAVGATQGDILRQFLAESVMQCLVGGLFGILAGFSCAVALRTFTDFPASVRTWVAVLGLMLSSVIGLFFGIYPAMRAARMDPVASLRSE